MVALVGPATRPLPLAPRLGVDLGQSRDNSALAAVEPQAAEDGGEPVYLVRQLGRLTLGTSYVDVAHTIVAASQALRARTALMPEVYLDATGVGAPVVDIVANPLREVAALRPVMITAGDAYTSRTPPMASAGSESVRPWGRVLYVGKVYLVSRLKSLLQAGRVKGAPTPEFEAVQKQLATFRVKAVGTRDVYGAMDAGTHDDLVIALALAVLEEPPTDVTGLRGLNDTMRGATLLGWAPLGWAPLG